MLEMIKLSLMYGAVGSTGATLAIIAFNVLTGRY